MTGAIGVRIVRRDYDARMDDSRWEPGMPLLDRQAIHEPVLPPSLQGLPPRSVPEVRPTPLQPYFIPLSVVGLIAGAIAITALEVGLSMSSPLVKLCVLVGVPPLLLANGDATLRIWRSARAWWNVNRGRAWFRLAWFGVTVILLVILVALASIVLSA